MLPLPLKLAFTTFLKLILGIKSVRVLRPISQAGTFHPNGQARIILNNNSHLKMRARNAILVHFIVVIQFNNVHCLPEAEC